MTQVNLGSRRVPYPEIVPYRTGMLRVSDVHEIYYEESGNPHGQPALFIHGGPGSGTEPSQRRFFDPNHYRIVLFDQRGAGRSTPHACLEDNTTWHLVSDMEALRQHLGVSRWLLFGGSWGCTLALAYAQRHPDRVAAMVLRGVFLLRQTEVDWLYQRGASLLYPDAWEGFLEPIPPEERGDLLRAYYQRLTDRDAQVQKAAAHAWSRWEAHISRLFPDERLLSRMTEERFALALARIESHFCVNGGFLQRDTQLLEDVRGIRHIPAVIVQGRYDVVCPMESAWLLKQAWPEAELHVVADAGHSALEAGITHELVGATDRFREGARPA